MDQAEASDRFSRNEQDIKRSATWIYELISEPRLPGSQISSNFCFLLRYIIDTS